METVTNISKLSSAFGQKKTLILDNNIFKLHYKVTVTLLMASVFCLSGTTWMGKPISCITAMDEYRDFMESHCLVEGAKTIHPKAPGPLYQPQTIYPGVVPVHDQHQDYTLQRHHMYKWTMLTMFLMAVANYFPHYLWKVKEGGRLHTLVQGMDKELLDEDEARRRVCRAAKKIADFEESVIIYTFTYVFCEVLNVILCAAQMYYIHSLFNNQMWQQQSEIIKDIFSKDRKLKLLHEVFPKVIKCTLEKSGPSGTVEIVDAMCFFYQNAYTEMAFTLLWFWFFAIGIINVAHLACNRVGYLFKNERINILHNTSPTASKEDVRMIVNKMTMTQLFLLVELCKAIQSLHTDDLLKEVAKEMIRKQSRQHNNSDEHNQVIIGMN